MIGFRVKWMVGIAVALGMMVAGSLPAAHAIIERVGPVSNLPPIGGYPAWYQDTTGLTLEFCDPKNASEVEGGWCLLLPPNVPAPPEDFFANPIEFFDEHFWYSVGAVFPPAAGILWEAALEGAFAADVAPGGQIVFTRIRVRFDVTVPGTYRIIHPYGEDIIEGSAGQRIFFTDDVGINCPTGQFHCAMEGRVGPFLLPSATPGGAEMAPLTAANPAPDTDPLHFGGVVPPVTPYPGTGKAYIADPAREGPVTGSPTGNNLVRIEGPPGAFGDVNGIIETNNFTLMGRVFQGTIGSQVTVDRSSYTQPVASSPTGKKVDVFATAFPARAARLPGQTQPAAFPPTLQFYGAPCQVNTAGDLIAPPGVIPIPMSSPGALSPAQAAPASIYWGQSQPTAIPAGVCVEHVNAVGGSTVYSANVTDEVTITEALYDPANNGTLSVRATSSDQILAPQLFVAGLGDIGPTGQFVLNPLAAPPAKVRVLSLMGGFNEFQVSTNVGTGNTGSIPVAVNDSATVFEDCSSTPATSCAAPLLITPWSNDSVNGSLIVATDNPTVTIVQLPTRGVAAAVGGTVTYTPNPNANGADSFTYRVSVNGLDSNLAAVAVTITPVNDNPVAVDDAAVAVAGVSTQINVLSNDTDPDGAANLAGGSAGALIVTGNTALGIADGAVFVNGLVSFTPAVGTLPGPQTFTYQARDANGLVSPNTATVTVTVAGTETVTIQLAEFRTGGREWRVSGVVTPFTIGETITIRYVNGNSPTCDVDGPTPVTIGAGGAWQFREANVTGCRDPRNAGASQIRATGPAGGSGTANITLRR